MKTRTLLLLAVGCGLAILLAGGVQLLRVAGQDDPARPLRVGESATIGDAHVTVDLAEAGGDGLVVTLRVGGVDDPDAGDGFTLVTDSPLRPSYNGCRAFAETQRDCELRFDVGGAKTQARVLVFSRLDKRVRWNLASSSTTP